MKKYEFTLVVLADPEDVIISRTFTGDLSVFVSGGGVNEVRNMTITIAPSTVIKFAAS